MNNSSAYEVTLHLTDIRHLFTPPELDPLHGQVQTSSGMEQIMNELKPRSLARPVRTTIYLPKGRIPAQLPQECRRAVRAYCTVQIQQITNELASLRWQGLKALQSGIVFLAVCLLLSTLFDASTAMPDFLRRILGEGLLIVGWVSLWHPVELLLYEWWPHWRDRQLHERLRDMELEIVESRHGTPVKPGRAAPRPKEGQS